MLGQVPDAAGVMWHYPALLKDTMRFGRKTESWNRLDPNLASFATMAAAGAIGCSFCLDLHYFMTHNRGLDETKAREVPRWRESAVFTPLERRVMEYAEAMCQTPLTVTDEMSAALLDDAGGARAPGADHQGRRDEHDRPGQRRTRHPVAGVLGVLRPAAAGDPVGGRSRLGMTDDPFTRPPQPAVHRRLRDARLGRRRRRRGAGDLAAVGGGRTGRRCATRGPTWCGSSPARRSTGCAPCPAAARTTSGEWLPEPLLTSPDVADDVELAESVSIAMLTVLETLGPTERAVLVLHEVFDVPYDEIAEAVGKSSAAVRQIAHRAREHVAARRPRMAVSRAEQQRVVDRFLAAVTAGDLQGLMDVLAPDVVVVADSGGLAPAARRPVVRPGAGGQRALPLRRSSRRSWRSPRRWSTARSPRGSTRAASSTRRSPSSSRTAGSRRMYAMRNPHKLGRLDTVAELRR